MKISNNKNDQPFPNTSSPSILWKIINFFYISKIKVKNLSNFRSNNINYKIALFDPNKNGIRYLKTLTYCLSRSLSPNNFESLRNTKNRNLIGNPFTIKLDGEDICLDYLQAVLELEYIISNINKSNINNILEIGAGYGRTCHVLLSNINIKEYYIVDLNKTLQLAQNYLQQVLTIEQFKKIHFISVDNFNSLTDCNFDLCINIDSFSEICKDDVRYYLNFIDRHSTYFYVKNPVCNNLYKEKRKAKYLINSVLNKLQNKIAVTITQNFHLSDVIDIFNNEMIKNQVPKFIQIYKPAEDWECVANAWAMPWSNYWQAIYKKR